MPTEARELPDCTEAPRVEAASLSRLKTHPSGSAQSGHTSVCKTTVPVVDVLSGVSEWKTNVLCSLVWVLAQQLSYWLHQCMSSMPGNTSKALSFKKEKKKKKKKVCRARQEKHGNLPLSATVEVYIPNVRTCALNWLAENGPLWYWCQEQSKNKILHVDSLLFKHIVINELLFVARSGLSFHSVRKAVGCSKSHYKSSLNGVNYHWYNVATDGVYFLWLSHFASMWKAIFYNKIQT